MTRFAKISPRVPVSFCVLFAGLLLGGPVWAQNADGVCRVTPAGTANNDGASWAAPMDLQAALATTGCREVWVAHGVYVPGSSASDTFDIRPGVRVLGGFAGGETAAWQRDPAAHASILSGDIDGDDTGVGGVDLHADAIVGTNSRHVVTMDGTTTAGPIKGDTLLDGFIITGGDDRGGSGVGGGLYCRAFVGHVCSPQLTRLTFLGNAADYGGGVMLDATAGGSSQPLIAHVTFSGNHADAYGGALLAVGSGGNASPIFIDVTFADNSADAGGGAVRFNGSDGGVSNPVLRNVTFAANQAGYGGAIGVTATHDGTSKPQLTNVVLWGNHASIAGAELYASDGYGGTFEPVIDHSIIQGSGGSGSAWWGNQGITDSGGNLDADPELGPLGIHGGATATMLIGATGAAIDAGNDALCPAYDQRGLARPQGAHCDIGAVEFDTGNDTIFSDGFDRGSD